MKREILETLTGVIVLAVLGFLVYYSINMGRVDFFGGGYYPVYADFDSVSGLEKGATVEIAGVDVGRVDAITLEPKSDMAKVRMEIKDGVKLQEDVVASIRAKGIIGDDYMSISPGESSQVIPPGGVIMHTKPTIDFEQLMSQFVQGKV